MLLELCRTNDNMYTCRMIKLEYLNMIRIKNNKIHEIKMENLRKEMMLKNKFKRLLQGSKSQGEISFEIQFAPLRRSLSRQCTININNSYCDNHPLKGSYYKNRNISGCIKPITQIPLDRMLSIKQKLRLILPKITKSSESKLSPKRKMKKGSQISTLS